MRRCDVLIVGGGLAGCVLAWELSRRGKQALIVDRNDPVTSSRIAAGLLTPITGQRLTVAWGWADFRPAAEEFYRHIEAITGQSLFSSLEMVRLFVSEREQLWFESKRRDNPAYAHVLGKPSAWDAVCQERSTGPYPPLKLGGFVMRGGARLDVPALLTTTRDTWQSRDDWIVGDVTDADFSFDEGRVVVEKWDLAAENVVLCRGAADGFGPEGSLFPRQDLRPAKGEILDVKIPGWTDPRVVHRGMWLVPTGPGQGRAGATYDWNQFDNLPTDGGRHDIQRSLRELVSAPVEVIGHQAAVRPTPRAYRPLIGRHPAQPRVAIFNGLGSRGALQAPLLARHLCDHLYRGQELPADIQPRHWETPPTSA